MSADATCPRCTTGTAVQALVFPSCCRLARPGPNPLHRPHHRRSSPPAGLYFAQVSQVPHREAVWRIGKQVRILCCPRNGECTAPSPETGLRSFRGTALRAGDAARALLLVSRPSPTGALLAPHEVSGWHQESSLCSTGCVACSYACTGACCCWWRASTRSACMRCRDSSAGRHRLPTVTAARSRSPCSIHRRDRHQRMSTALRWRRRLTRCRRSP